MTILRLPDIVKNLALIDKTNEIIDVVNASTNSSYSRKNPSLTAVDGVCTWTVTHNLGTEDVSCTIYQGENEVLAEIEVISANVVSVKINSPGNIASDSYSILVLAKGGVSTSGGDTIEVDEELSLSSTNPVQNKTITGALGNFEPVNKAINATGTTGTLALADNSVYKCTPTGNITFSLPSISNNGVFHQILVQLKLNSTYSVNVGTSYYFNNNAPDFSTTGSYTIAYEYDSLENHWVCGSCRKGTV